MKDIRQVKMMWNQNNAIATPHSVIDKYVLAENETH